VAVAHTRPRLVVVLPPRQYRRRICHFLRWLAREWPPTRVVKVHFVNELVGSGRDEAPYAVAQGGRILYVAAGQPGASWLAIAQAAAEAYSSAVRFAPDRRAWARRALRRYQREVDPS
jgi:hypothetical protein